MNPLKNPIEVYVFFWNWGQYMGHGSLDSGVDVCVSSWRRMAADTLPAASKAAANYMNAQLIKIEAITNGYSEAIALDSTGYVSEASGANVFLVRGRKLVRAPLASAALPGIARDTVMTLAQELAYSVSEQPIPRDALHG